MFIICVYIHGELPRSCLSVAASLLLKYVDITRECGCTSALQLAHCIKVTGVFSLSNVLNLITIIFELSKFKILLSPYTYHLLKSIKYNAKICFRKKLEAKNGTSASKQKC